MKSWLISDPFIQTHLRIRIADIILCTIHGESDLTNRGGDRPKCHVFVTSLAFSLVKTTGQHSIFWSKSVSNKKGYIGISETMMFVFDQVALLTLGLSGDPGILQSVQLSYVSCENKFDFLA